MEMDMDTDIEMTDIPLERHQDAPGVGRPGLRPPPGFEHLLPGVASDNASDSDAGSSYMLSQDPNEISANLGEPYVAVEAPSPSSSPPLVADRGEDEKGVQKTETSDIRPLRITKIRLKTASMTNRTDSEQKASEPSPEDQSGDRPSGQSTALSQAATQTGGSGPAGGMFPFPPPTGDQIDNLSTHSELSMDEMDNDKENEKPENIIRPSAPLPGPSKTLTYAQLSPHHRLQMLDMMKRKFSDIQQYEKSGNENIMHVDWVAGNPKDPLTTNDPLGDVCDGDGVGLSDEDRVLQSQLIDLVTSFVNEAQGHPRDDDWSKAMFFGDWMHNSTGENMYFIEIQIKRISGADDNLLKRCGVNPRYVWLPLAENIVSDPSLLSSSPMRGHGSHSPSGTTLAPLVNLPGSIRREAHRDASPESPSAQQSRREHLGLPPIGTFPSPVKKFATLTDIILGARERRMNTLNAAAKETDNTPIDPRLEASGQDSEPKQSDAMDTTPDSKETENTGPSPTGSPDAPKPPGIPRSLPNLPPMKPSPSWGSTVTTCGDSEDDFAAASSPLSSSKKLPTVRELLAFQKAVGRRQEKTLEQLLQDPEFEARKKNSFVYAVRVVAIPERCHVLNAFNGPDKEERYATLLGSGGWVVPPLEERIKWHNDRKENRTVAYDMTDATTTGGGNSIGKKVPQVCRALPLCFDWTGNTSPRYYGESPPLWRELADPCLEDVYWMVWQLFAGRQFVGFRSGTGFGQKPLTTRGDANLVRMCQFKSPSREALRSSARF